MKQKTLRVFEVENFEKLKNVVENKYELIKNYYFLLKKPDKKTEEYLKSKNLNFFVLNSDKSFLQKEIEKIQIIEKEIVKETIKEAQIFDKIIRSGEELVIEGDVVFLKRINPGAKIEVKGNLILLEENHGFIKAEGLFALIKKNRGNIFFNNEDIGEIDKITFFYKDKRLEV